MIGGERVQSKRGGFATKRDAEAQLAEVLDAQRRGVKPSAGAVLVGDYLRDWLEAKVAAGLRPTTARSYRSHIENYLVPHLGTIRLRELTALDVEKGLREAATSPIRGAGPATIGRVRATLRSALGSAVRKRLVPFNAAGNLDLPRAPRPKVRPWEPEEVGAFLDHAATDPLGVLYEVIVMSGLRRGEALGLRWADVDVDRGVLTIRQALVTARNDEADPCVVCGGHESTTFGPPKTASGEARIVDLDERTTGALLAQRIAQDADREAWGTRYVDHDLVFAQPDGMPLQPDRVTKHFVALAREAGLRPIRLHDLRHGQASLLLAAGVDLAVVSKRLGHSSFALTVDTYSHLLGGVGRAAADAAAGLVPRSTRYQSATSEAPEGGTPAPETVARVSGPPGDRTLNPRIKSPLLCRLS
ncbi:site-specific recombinase XerD [Kineococcus rhizosphaerae]|uniref:Site-specific recombinase XerD n=1 Tax=Kineococcus rhizosphaerae TaxID=559628 RepID=A0A2T0R250_9ACTN|nr:site-specific recombinase XerD [Kineococcus rhizosphaerae]